MRKQSMTLKHLGYFLSAVTIIALPAFSKATHASSDFDRSGTLWAPYIEWTLDNESYEGNPFDLVATATFVYANEAGSAPETRTTEMFYAGGTSWKFRFTGTRTGTWNFTTSSSDADLGKKTGKITISPNTNPGIKGFLRTSGNKFTRQIGENGELEVFLFNVHQSSKADDIDALALFKNPDPLSAIDRVINDVKKNGGTVLFPQSPRNRFFDINAEKWNQHSSKNPDMNTFVQLEKVITRVHSQGLHFHFWAWGDEERQETPIGVCHTNHVNLPHCTNGINGVADKRLQRYIAARLGPLPGWTMGYGFDLQEWVSEAQTGEWAKYLHQHFGWQHLLWARGRTHSELDVLSYSGFGNYGYTDATNKLDSDLTRPHLYGERFLYLREDYWGMDGTRQKRWQYAMAGGMGSWWGWYWFPPRELPNPEQMRTHKSFWDNRYLFDMLRANELTDGYALKTLSSSHYIFYKENTSSISMNLSGMNGAQSAVAIDTKKEYAEINIGPFTPGDGQVWNAPHPSDWAIAIGIFAGSLPPPLPSAPSNETMIINNQ